MSQLCRAKYHGWQRFWRNRLIWAQGCTLRTGWSRTPAQKLFVSKELDWIWSFHSIKSYSIPSQVQTDTQCMPSMVNFRVIRVKVVAPEKPLDINMFAKILWHQLYCLRCLKIIYVLIWPVAISKNTLCWFRPSFKIN